MTAMAGISIRASIRLQHRVFPIPWVKNSSIVASLKARDYSSSGPVRFIPKSSSNNRKPRTPLPPAPEIVNGSDFGTGLDDNPGRIEVEHGGAVWRSKFYDELHHPSQNAKENYSTGGSMQGIKDEFNDNLSFVDDRLEEPEAVDEELNIYNKKTYCRNNNSQENESKKDAEQLAIELLAIRAYTASQMRKKLRARGFCSDTVDEVISDCESRGFIDDGLYAEAFCRSRWSSSTWGPRKLKQALLSKGIGGEVAQKAIKQVFEEGEDSDIETSSVGLSKVSMDHLFAQASKQWLRSWNAPKETRQSRMIQWLQYRGFNWGVTRTILKKLEAEYPP